MHLHHRITYHFSYILLCLEYINVMICFAHIVAFHCLQRISIYEAHIL